MVMLCYSWSGVYTEKNGHRSEDANIALLLNILTTQLELWILREEAPAML